MARLCSHLGLDAAYLQTELNTVSEEEQARRGRTVASSHQTIQHSTGVIKSQKRNFDIDLKASGCMSLEGSCGCAV